jgi:hypothetical protein
LLQHPHTHTHTHPHLFASCTLQAIAKATFNDGFGNLCGSLASRLDYGPFDTSSPHWRAPGAEQPGVRHPELDDEERTAVGGSCSTHKGWLGVPV